MKNVDLLINGSSQEAAGGAFFERQNPITGEVATRAAAATVEDALKAADAAAMAFPEWSETSPKGRREVLLSAADALKSRSDQIVEAMANEIGATTAWAMFNVGLAADMLVEAAAMTTQISGEIIPSNRPGSLAMAVRQPVGVVLSIAPWNAPVILGVRSIAMPLACGNSVVMKTSEICPNTHMQILEALTEGGLPNGVLNGISNAPETASEIVEALIAHRAVRRINFTGSTRVGKLIAETAGRHLKPALLELGGKAPAVILDDADLDHAVAAVAFGAYMNQGQICMSTERVIVDEAIADPFVEKLTEKVRTLKAGDPREGKTPLGSVVDKTAAQRIQELITDAVDKGAVVLAGGVVDGTIIGATLLDRVSPSMRIYREETFGPVACIYRAGSVDEAVRIANDTEYGLSASVFGQNAMRAMSVAQRIESGICHINGPTVHDEAQMPFGGMKESGYGRFGGKAGIDQFTELRWMTIQDGPLHFPI
ncbi:aldehyde dehydrogenase [Sneathiella limimaris]|uniref:aldehyde dehydrogenase n=1 Tax=Sneathiella limimaris TaxID=1964213 RepID=UPI00146D1D2A|nr:aldehyde dehydrogenase [Sneathiella limimaris]